ncbi:Uncharacterised protein [Salmonella enterica subsp. enterica serovar Sanjuan]|uniref:Uncharacterized protein n=1 Tax=Salmonella enterica subsp. enterica serovar Sanjuan TaxID=1160765 RepID=A0A3S5DBQ4_SALET|nr:Uncharacterised protein [Salmonella enterica subsp. enterica serovar Sanjuan]
MNFRRALSARDPDSSFYHEASDSFLAKNQTVNFLQIFPRQRGAKITVVLPDYTECLICQLNWQQTVTSAATTLVVHAKWSELTITFQQPAAMAWRNAEHLSSLTGT